MLLRISKIAVGITVRKERNKKNGGEKKKVKTKTIGTLLIAGLVVLSAMVVFAGTVAAQDDDPIKIYGYITDANGDPVVGTDVTIKKDHSGAWHTLATSTTNSSGFYNTGWIYIYLKGYGGPLDTYQMYVNGNLVAEEAFDEVSDWDINWCIFWSKQWDYQIPEFATIAIPAIAVLGLFLFFNKRKHKKD
jgi:hypothetical protein